MKKQLITYFLFLSATFAFGEVYKTQTFSNEIQTLKVTGMGSWLRAPIMEMRSNDFIQISFDQISDNTSERLMYRLVHCNADWTPSSLSDIEYLDGFNNSVIDDYELSMNTTVEYTNFRLTIPNKDVKLKVSGNYTVLVYGEDEPNKILLTACFSVLDKRVEIGGSISTNTDVDLNKEHQQLSFTVNYSNLSVMDPVNNFKIYVTQNNRLDNERREIKPNFLSQNKLVFEHNQDLIFEAGNEYRRFETVSSRYNGLNVNSTQFVRPFYVANIVPDKIRARRSYVYDQDQDGRYLIRNSEVAEDKYDTDADYFDVAFTLESDEPILGNIYLNGDFTNNTFSDTYLMHYDSAKKAYTASIRLKQGAYNYQYLTKVGQIYSTAPVEGNYYETENEYCILAYYRPVGQRYDSLVGMLVVKK